jgi:thymidylate synthase (FAD)
MSRVELLDHGYLDLVDSWGSDEDIIRGARMSTGKGFLGWGPLCDYCGATRDEEDDPCPNIPGNKHAFTKPGDEKLLKYLWDNKHSTPFEMAGATFEVQAPIFVFREWHRHRVPFGYSEASARYAPLPDLNYVPSLERLALTGGPSKQSQTMGVVADREKAEEFRESLQAAYAMCEDLYQSALAMGVAKELARVILPVGRYSKMRTTGNLRGWLGFLELRNAPTAQHEIRVYAEALQKMLAEKFPRTLALFVEGR